LIFNFFQTFYINQIFTFHELIVRGDYVYDVYLFVLMEVLEKTAKEQDKPKEEEEEVVYDEDDEYEEVNIFICRYGWHKLEIFYLPPLKFP